MMRMETQVAIVGAGPAGLMLSHLLHQYGIDSVVVELRSREHCETRIRAGVLEQGTVDLLRASGLATRLDREGMVHRAIRVGFQGRLHRIPLSELTQGRAITVYGQHEVVKDLIAARLAAAGQTLFDCENVSLRGLEGPHPAVHFDREGHSIAVKADFIAGCDGFHGVSRPSAPPSAWHSFERHFPFAWLGVLAQAAPSSDELVYMSHERGFALFSMRSPRITRLYLQCPPDEDPAAWSDDRIWSELLARFGNAGGWRPIEGPILQKNVAAMRSFVVEPMQYGRLFLAGDAAHIVPSTGAKGMNLAIADVAVLASGLNCFYRESSMRLLDRYSEICLRRVWLAQRFSCWMTLLLHNCHSESPFESRRRYAELHYLTASRAASTSLAENYTGLPLDIPS